MAVDGTMTHEVVEFAGVSIQCSHGMLVYLDRVAPPCLTAGFSPIRVPETYLENSFFQSR